MTLNSRRDLLLCFFGLLLCAPLVVGAVPPPPDGANPIALPPDSAFSYSANGKDEKGLYRILTYWLTGRDQTGVNPRAWFLIARPTNKNSIKNGAAEKYYTAEKVQVNIDCQSLSYLVVTEATLDSSGKVLSQWNYPENSGLRRLLPDKRNHSLPKREDVPAMTHAMTILDESCYPFE